MSSERSREKEKFPKTISRSTKKVSRETSQRRNDSLDQIRDVDPLQKTKLPTSQPSHSPPTEIPPKMKTGLSQEGINRMHPKPPGLANLMPTKDRPSSLCVGSAGSALNFQKNVGPAATPSSPPNYFIQLSQKTSITVSLSPTSQSLPSPSVSPPPRLTPTPPISPSPSPYSSKHSSSSTVGPSSLSPTSSSSASSSSFSASFSASSSSTVTTSSASCTSSPLPSIRSPSDGNSPSQGIRSPIKPPSPSLSPPTVFSASSTPNAISSSKNYHHHHHHHQKQTSQILPPPLPQFKPQFKPNASLPSPLERYSPRRNLPEPPPRPRSYTTSSPPGRRKSRDTTCQRSQNWVRLNVGGQIFVTTKGSLCSDPSSMLAALFDPSSPFSSTCDETGAYLFDRDPSYFRVVLNYLRTGKVRIDPSLNVDAVRDEAEFFQVSSMLDDLDPRHITDLTRHEIIISRKNIQSFAGLRLSGLDMAFLNFKKEIFSRADLRRCNFSFSKMQEAKLAHVNAHKAIFDSTRLAKADLREAMFKNARFTGANMVQAILCSSDLRYARLSRSDCTGALFQKATLVGADFSNAILKQAKFQNCDLRHADFSFADLSEAHFTGADLRGATLNWEDWEDHTYFRNAIVTQNQYDQISMSKRAKRELRLTVVEDDHDLEDEDWYTNTEGTDTNFDDVPLRPTSGSHIVKLGEPYNFVFFVVKGTGTKDKSSGKPPLGYLNVRDSPGGNLIGRIDEGTRVRSYLNKSMVCVKGLYWQEILIRASDQNVVLKPDRTGAMNATDNVGIRRIGAGGIDPDDETPLQQNIEEACSPVTLDADTPRDLKGGSFFGEERDDERYISPDEDDGGAISGEEQPLVSQRASSGSSRDMISPPSRQEREGESGLSTSSGFGVGGEVSSARSGGKGKRRPRRESYELKKKEKNRLFAPSNSQNNLHMNLDEGKERVKIFRSISFSRTTSPPASNPRTMSPSRGVSPLINKSTMSPKGSNVVSPVLKAMTNSPPKSPRDVLVFDGEGEPPGDQGRRVTWALKEPPGLVEVLAGWVPAIYLRREP